MSCYYLHIFKVDEHIKKYPQNEKRKSNWLFPLDNPPLIWSAPTNLSKSALWRKVRIHLKKKVKSVHLLHIWVHYNVNIFFFLIIFLSICSSYFPWFYVST